MLKIRNEQMEALRKALADNTRQAKIQDFRSLGFKAEEDAKTKDILVEDAGGGTARLALRADSTLVTTGEGRTFRAEHDKKGQLAAFTDPAGLRLSFNHDEKGRLVAIQRGQHSNYHLEYDDDNLTATSFPDGTSTRFAYDGAGRLLFVTDRNRNKVRYGYSDTGSLIRAIDAGGNLTRFEHEEAGGLSAIVFADGTRHDFEFNKDDYLQKIIINGKEHATFQLDEQAGTFNIDYADNTRAHFVYSNGKIVEATNETCAVKLEYDDKGNLVSEDTNGQVVQYIRSEVGALLGIITPDGERLTFERDHEHSVRQITDWAGGRYSINYAPVGALASIRYPNGASLRMTATEMGLAESLKVFSPISPEPIVLRQWDYDNCDRAIKMTDGIDARQYRYDGEGRLVEVVSSDARVAERFELDANGNRIRDDAGTCQFNSLNQLTHRGGSEFAYDDRGNMTSRTSSSGQACHTYNGRDHLVAVETPQGEIRYAYDAFGRRVRKEHGKKITHYVWAGQQLLSEITADGANTTRRDFLTFPERSFPLAMRVDGKVFYLHPGRLGEPLCMTDGQGAVVWQADYSAFGKARVFIEKISQPWRLAGQYFDDETGLHYVLARYYDPASGRYLTMDPLRVDGGSLNFYTYCDGDPINRYDPTGAFIIPAILIAIAIGAVIGAVIGAGVEMYKQYKTKGKIDDGWAIAKEAGIGAVVGAVGGAIGFASAGASLAVAGLIGGVASATEYCTEQTLRGEEITAKGVVGNFLLGGVIGTVTAGVGGLWAARTARKAQQAAKAIQEAERRLAREAEDTLAREAAEEAARKSTQQKRLADLSIDPQTKKVNPKAIEEAETILDAEEKGIVKGAQRDQAHGEDFKVDGGHAEVKNPRPIPQRPLSVQAKDIADKSSIYGKDVKVIVDLKRLDPVQKAQFKADLIKEGADMSKIHFVND